jgi:hypothetical protein
MTEKYLQTCDTLLERPQGDLARIQSAARLHNRLDETTKPIGPRGELHTSIWVTSVKLVEIRQWTLRPCAGPSQRAPSRHRDQDILELVLPLSLLLSDGRIA